MRMRLGALLAALAGALGWAVADGGDPAVARGKKLFHDTQGLEYASCAHCHNLVPEKLEAKKAEHLGPGGTLWGSVARAGWRNRSKKVYADIGEASQTCAKKWQKRKGGFKEAERRDLVAFLATQQDPERPALPAREVERKPKLPRDLAAAGLLAGGDAARGAKLTERFCGGCHAEDDDALSFELKPKGKKKPVIARKVRGYTPRGKFKPETGSMAYYTTDRLSDEQLRDILAHLGR